MLSAYDVAMEETRGYVSTLATREEIAGIRDAFGESGIPIELEAIIPPQGVEIPWLIVADLPVKDFLVAVAGGAGWSGLVALFNRLRDAQQPKRRFWQRKTQPRQGQLAIRPPVDVPDDIEPDHRPALIMGWIGQRSPGTELAIPSDLPDEGFRKLFELDLDAYPNHYIYWNPESGEWGSHEKEAPQSAEETEHPEEGP
jgi:hypothetical protein